MSKESKPTSTDSARSNTGGKPMVIKPKPVKVDSMNGKRQDCCR